MWGQLGVQALWQSLKDQRFLLWRNLPERSVHVPFILIIHIMLRNSNSAQDVITRTPAVHSEEPGIQWVTVMKASWSTPPFPNIISKCLVCVHVEFWSLQYNSCCQFGGTRYLLSFWVEWRCPPPCPIFRCLFIHRKTREVRRACRKEGTFLSLSVEKEKSRTSFKMGI